MVQFYDHLSYSCKNNEMETAKRRLHWFKKRMLTSSIFSLFPKIKYLLFMLQNCLSLEGAFVWWRSLSRLTINLSCTGSEKKPNTIIHQLFSQKLHFWTLKETAWMNNLTVKRNNEQHLFNRVKIKLGVRQSG